MIPTQIDLMCPKPKVVFQKILDTVCGHGHARSLLYSGEEDQNINSHNLYNYIVNYYQYTRNKEQTR